MNDNTVYSLFYVSKADSNLNDSDLQKILKSSFKHNETNRITGLLILTGGNFLQLLEGSKEHVVQTYNRISQDKRNSDCRIIVQDYLGPRRFSSWCMAYENLSGDKIACMLGRSHTNIGFLIDEITSDQIKTVFQQLYLEKYIEYSRRQG